MKYFISFILFSIFLNTSIISQDIDSSKVVTVVTKNLKYFSGDLIKMTEDSIFIETKTDGEIAFRRKDLQSIHNVELPTYFMLSPDTSEIVTVVTKKKKYFSGNLINITEDSIFIQLEEKEVMAFGKIDVRGIYNGALPPYFYETTNSSVPYYVQTALPNGRGNHYYKNYYIFGNEFNFGVLDNVNFSLGFETGSLIFDGGDQVPLIQIGAKYSFSTSEHFHLGLSTKYYFRDDGKVLLLNSPITFGGKRTNLTLSPNITFQEGPNLIGIFANVSLGLSDRSRFVVDYVYIDNLGITAIVYEYLFKSGFTLSLGALVADGSAAPNLAFSIPFGQWKRI